MSPANPVAKPIQPNHQTGMSQDAYSLPFRPQIPKHTRPNRSREQEPRPHSSHAIGPRTPRARKIIQIVRVASRTFVRALSAWITGQSSPVSCTIARHPRYRIAGMGTSPIRTHHRNVGMGTSPTRTNRNTTGNCTIAARNGAISSSGWRPMHLGLHDNMPIRSLTWPQKGHQMRIMTEAIRTIVDSIAA
jgi:hypothetical protein